jgi:hypothetical protein
MSPDEQEARSRRYSNDVIMLLPLQSGSVAIFNRAGDLCDIMHLDDPQIAGFMSDIVAHWHPPATRARPSLEELGL